MRAIILAGGLGTRLAPYTTIIPKPLMPVGGSAIIELLIRQLVGQGVDRITLCLGHRSRIIKLYLADIDPGVEIDYSEETEPLGTMGPLRLIDDLPEDFLVLNGDLFTDVSFERLFASHRESGGLFSIGAVRRELATEFGVLETDASGSLVGFKEKPNMSYVVSMGIYVMNRAAVELIPEGRAFGFDELMLKLLELGKNPRVFEHDGTLARPRPRGGLPHGPGALRRAGGRAAQPMTDTVLVTGATGFVGSALSDRLEQQGARVLRASSSLGHDVTDPSGLDAFKGAGVDMVCHLAARTFVPDAWADPAGFYEVNVLGTQRALDFCHSAGRPLPLLLRLRLRAPERLPVGESHPVRPAHPYAHSKWLGEELCRFYAKAWELPVSIVRPFNIYGAGQDERFVIASIVRQWARERRVRVATTAPSGTSSTSTTSSTLSGSRPANRSPGRPRTSASAVVLGRRSDRRPRTRGRRGGAVRADRPDAPGDIPDVVADCRLVREGTWKPSTSLEQGLEAMVRASRQ